jgi:hypothetical protein
VLVNDEHRTERQPLPPDPAAYDSVRATQARAKGLDQPYIAGGHDPDPDQGLREERYYGRWLLIMIVVIAVAGFVLGIIGNLLAAAGAPGAG